LVQLRIAPQNPKTPSQLISVIFFEGDFRRLSSRLRVSIFVTKATPGNSLPISLRIAVGRLFNATLLSPGLSVP